MMFANLHLHSVYSDAGFTPEQLVLIGKAMGYGALALTDHETDGGCKEFMEVCAREGIESVIGTEFYGQYGERKMHLTALDFDPANPNLRQLIDERCRLYADWTKICFDACLAGGYFRDISWDYVVALLGEGAWLCEDSILYALRIQKKYSKELETRIHTEVFKSEEMLACKPAYPQAADVIRAVRQAGGVIALAHSVVTQYDYVEKLVDLGLNGIEVNHPSMTPEAITMAEELAERRGLYRCGGTDHTGPMSCVPGKYAYFVENGISEGDFQILKERRLG